MNKNKLPLLVSCLMVIAGVADAKSLPGVQQLQQTSKLVQQAGTTIQKVELHLVELYDLARQSSHGSYSYTQREQMNAQFQAILPMIDLAVKQAEVGGLNMLDSADEIIEVNARGDIFRFLCADITLAGLNLNGNQDISRPETAALAFYSVEAAVRRIKEVDLAFTGHINILSTYVPYLCPIPDKEARQALERMVASKAGARSIVLNLDRAIDLINAVQTGAYSEVQRIIMNAEFQELLSQCDALSGEVYYGMGMIDSTDVLVVDTRGQKLEFDCFDLTKNGLGLDTNLVIDTRDAARAAYPAVISGFQSAVNAMISLDDDSETLAEYLPQGE